MGKPRPSRKPAQIALNFLVGANKTVGEEVRAVRALARPATALLITRPAYNSHSQLRSPIVHAAVNEKSLPNLQEGKLLDGFCGNPFGGVSGSRVAGIQKMYSVEKPKSSRGIRQAEAIQARESPLPEKKGSERCRLHRLPPLEHIGTTPKAWV